MSEIIATIPNFKEGDIKCYECGREIYLFYNNGELDQEFCCGYEYRTKHLRTDLFISLAPYQ